MSAGEPPAKYARAALNVNVVNKISIVIMFLSYLAAKQADWSF